MWTRGELKGKAKQTLRKYYWWAFLATLTAAILGGYGGSGAPGFSFSFNNANMEQIRNGWASSLHNGSMNFPDYWPAIAGALAALVAILAIVALIAAAISIVYQIFVAGPLAVGKSRFFLEARQDRAEIANLFYSFRSGRYMSAVKALAWRLLFTFLWTLLFIIPGIVKSYAYSMIPYIMADNPCMDYKRAMRLSMDMTRGQKWDIFVLDLSFIGWGLLGMLACGVGVLFLLPYINATKAELYVTLKRKALDSGLVPAGELGEATVPAV
jgi:uncharacterized membrane protein